jgi:spermidine synthase
VARIVANGAAKVVAKVVAKDVANGVATDDPAVNAPFDSARQLLFVSAILASAFLIFLVQPMVGKRILPWFGGVPSVWTLCLAFYQTTLFVGYAYAHLLIRFASPTIQLIVHALVIGTAWLVLPVLPDSTWQPVGVDTPTSDIFRMLTSNVALPFLVLASTGPLVQAWFARTHPGRSPYPLYAVSNLGSFAALLAYPFVLEPRMTLSETGTLWSYAFAATALLVLSCAVVARSTRVGPGHDPTGGVSDFDESSGFPSPGRVALWFLFSGCAVILLMGVTNSVCLDVASVPFLWIIPLATYLLTFILCFSSERVYRPLPYLVLSSIGFALTLGLTLLDSWGIALEAKLVRSVYVQIPGYCALLFGTCMIMHGELYRLRPPPRMLTGYYLCVSGGGAAGGLFVGLLAPVLFDGYYEVRVGVALAVLLLSGVVALRANETNSGDGLSLGRRVMAPLGFILLVIAMWPYENSSRGVVKQERGFFGVLRVVENEGGTTSQRALVSGSTLHGLQFLGEASKRIPTSYYGAATGIGLALSQRQPDQLLKVGVVGLGIGTLATYGREGDSYRFYEVDPSVVRIARDAGYFSFLADSDANVEIVTGDARLSIVDEQMREGSQEFDFLIVDAFTSDSIPVHLLTVEAFRHYASALSPAGVLAVHVSNRHFNLTALVARLGFEIDLTSAYTFTARALRHQSKPSQWMLLSRSPERLHDLAIFMKNRVAAMGLSETHLSFQKPYETRMEHVPLWTDDYSDLFGVLRRK